MIFLRCDFYYTAFFSWTCPSFVVFYCNSYSMLWYSFIFRFIIIICYFILLLLFVFWLIFLSAIIIFFVCVFFIFLFCCLALEFYLSAFLIVLNLLFVSIILVFLNLRGILPILLLSDEANLFIFIEVMVLTDCVVFVTVEFLEVSLE